MWCNMHKNVELACLSFKRGVFFSFQKHTSEEDGNSFQTQKVCVKSCTNYYYCYYYHNLPAYSTRYFFFLSNLISERIHAQQRLQKYKVFTLQWRDAWHCGRMSMRCKQFKLTSYCWSWSKLSAEDRKSKTSVEHRLTHLHSRIWLWHEHHRIAVVL